MCRLADRLSRHDADRRTDGYHIASSQISPVTHRADALAELTGHWGSYQHSLYLGFLDRGCALLADFLVALDEHLASLGMDHGCGSHPTEESLGHILSSYVICGADPSSASGATVVGIDDDILSYVHQAACQVPGIGGAQGCIGKTLARAVGADEILQGRKPLAQVAADRQRDDATRRISHQAAHTGQLGDGAETALGCPRLGHNGHRACRCQRS